MSEIAFEKIKHINEFDNEFWYARELGVALEYASFDKFKNVIAKAIVACKNSGIDENYHFSRVGKMVDIGSKIKSNNCRKATEVQVRNV